MSDGNFNRSLLPHTPYHSGLQTGKSIAKMKAVEAFRVYIAQESPTLSSQEIENKVLKFKRILSSKI